MRSSAAVAMLSVLLLAACSGVPERPEQVLDGTAWKLSRWSDASADPGAFTITATFADGRVAGKAAVNNYFAGYTEGPDDKFTVRQAGSTMMAGPPAAMQAEKIYLALLAQAQRYSRTATTLILSDAEGRVLLQFSPAAP